MKWFVHGQVGIAFAPGALITLGNVLVGEMPHLPLIEPARMTGLHRPHSISLLEGVPQFHTNGWYTAEVSAANELEAERVAQDEVEPVLHAALSLAFGYPVIIRLHSITNADTGQSSAPSDAVSSLPTRDLPVVSESVVTAYAAVQGGKTKQAVLRHLKRAHDLHLSGGFGDSRVSLEAELLELAKAIEAMSRDKRFQDHYADRVEIERKRGLIVENLRTTISEATAKKAAEAIKGASNELKRLETAFGSQQVERMSHALGLDHEWRQIADALGKVRNKTLAHSGPGLSENEAQKLLGGSFGSSAWWAVMECFASYCNVSSLCHLPVPERFDDLGEGSATAAIENLGDAVEPDPAVMISGEG